MHTARRQNFPSKGSDYIMDNRWLKGSFVAVFALGMFACSSPSVDVPASSSGGSGAPPSATTPSDPGTPPDTTKPMPGATNPVGSGESKTVAIDNSVGGSVELSDGTKLEIPAGALPDGVTEISITSATSAAPAVYNAVSPLFVFGPEGTVFSSPVKISFPVTIPSNLAASDLTVLWSRLHGQGYDKVPTEYTAIAGGKVLMTGTIQHFSTGFAGEKWTTDPLPNTDPYQE